MVVSGQLPPDPIPPLLDPCFSNKPGPYAHSRLRDVCGTRINPDAIGVYERRSLAASPQCAVKSCVHPEIEGWLGDVASFDPRAQVVQPTLSQWPFSAVIPRISLWGEFLPYSIEPATYMIDYVTLNSDPAQLPSREWVGSLRRRFPEGSRLLLGFFGATENTRALTVGLWTQSEFWYAPFLKNFDGIVVPDFSPYSDDPLPQMYFGERMMQIFAQEGSDAGHSVIPYVAWCTEDSLRRQIEFWSSRAPRVNTVLVDGYGMHIDKTGWAWRNLFAIEKYCANKPYIRWLITGMTSGWAIRELNRIFPAGNYCLITPKSSFIRAMSATTDKERMSRAFRRSISKLEEFKTGVNVADPLPRPDNWPNFAELVRST